MFFSQCHHINPSISVTVSGQTELVELPSNCQVNAMVLLYTPPLFMTNFVLLQKKYTQSDMTEEDNNRFNVSRDDDDARLSRRNSWGSFRRRRPLNLGEPNTAFQTDGPATRFRVSDYNQAPVSWFEFTHKSSL